MNRIFSGKTIEELGKYLLDISKIMFGGVIVSGVFGNGGSIVVVLAFAVMLLSGAFGIYCVRMSEK